MGNQKVVLLSVMLLAPLWIFHGAQAANTTYRMQTEDLYNKTHGSRIDRNKMKKRDWASKRFEYLSRVANTNPSKEYQKLLEEKIFADEKFTRKCWNPMAKKQLDFFFTVSPSGKAEDFAWFPKDRAAKCIQRHISKIELPIPEDTHHSWLLVTNL
ncbi:MAG: hypothetical protein AAF431_17760 [Pseudomonadota bacterium]